MSISGSVLRNRAVLLIYLRAVSDSYFTVHCFNSESVFQPWWPHLGGTGGKPAYQRVAFRQLWRKPLYFQRRVLFKRSQSLVPPPPALPPCETAVSFVLITPGTGLIMSWWSLEIVASLVGGNGNWGHLAGITPVPGGICPPDIRHLPSTKQETWALGRMSLFLYDNVTDL